MAARKTRGLEDLCKDLVAIACPCLAPFDLFALHIVVCSMCEPPCLGHLARIMCIVVCSMCEPPCVNHLACTCRTPLQTAGDGGGDNLEVCPEGEAHGRVPRLVRTSDEEGACKVVHACTQVFVIPTHVSSLAHVFALVFRWSTHCVVRGVLSHVDCAPVLTNWLWTLPCKGLVACHLH